MSAHYNLNRSGAQYLFNLVAPNGETILTSERYTTKQNAQNGINSCRVNSPYDGRYARRTSTLGQPYFTLHGGNGEVIGASEMYSSVSAREAGVQSVKTYGPTAPVRDNT